MCVSLRPEEEVYGILNVYLPAKFARQTEVQTLFKEVTNDIAFALHGIDQEERRRRAEQELAAERTLLARRVNERTAELVEANVLLQQEVVERQHTQAELQKAKEAAEFANRAKIVGGKTAETTGNLIDMILPRGDMFQVCSKVVTYPDGQEFVGYGITPDVEIKPSQIEIF